MMHKYDEIDSEPSEEEEYQRRVQQVQIFGSELNRLATKQVGLKQELEKRWLTDVRHYSGRSDSKTERQSEQSGTAKPFVNKTRSQTNAAESKWGDLVLPTDDRNWGIKPTPVPSLAIKADSDKPVETPEGQQVTNEAGEIQTESDLARAVMTQAKKASSLMQDEIDDQLTESNYNAVCRDVIHHSVVLGTGIIKGPMVERRTNKAWIESDDGQWALNEQADYKPFVGKVDPWNFFPDMSATSWDDCEFVFERHLLTRKKVRNLLKRPGFIKSQVKDLLMSSPNGQTAQTSNLNELREINGITTIQNDSRYEIWEYHGPIDKENLVACGCDGVDIDNPLDELDGTVWFSGGIVLKVSLNHMDDESLPYSVLCWEHDDVSIFGFGVPYRMRHSQRVMNASWRMVLDNAALSTGPQIVINQSKVEPANGNWELASRKIWLTTDKDVRVQDAFGAFHIENNQNALSSIFQMANQIAEEETSLPKLNMGNNGPDQQQPAAMKTLGGQAMWMASNNIMMRRAVKNFDDDITSPFIRRMYDWNMQFSTKKGIKGDYRIDARGTSVLLVKEMQAQNLASFVNTALSLPGGVDRIKVDGILAAMAKSLQISEGEIIKSDADVEAEAKANEGQEAPPNIDMLKIEAQQQIAQMSLQEKQIEAEARIQDAAMSREVDLTKIAVDERLSLAEIQTKYKLGELNSKWDREKFYTEIGIKRESGLKANYGLGQ